MAGAVRPDGDTQEAVDAMMPRYQIPPDDIPKLEALLKLSDDEVAVLEGELANTALVLNIDACSKNIARALDNEAAGMIVDLLITLQNLRTDGNEPVADFASAITDAARRVRDRNLAPPDDDWTILSQRLVRLLSVPKSRLPLIAKGVALWHEHANVFVDAVVLTDLRPVFGEEASGPPDAALVVHSLKIVYLHEGRVREIVVGIDREGIGSLRKALARAEHKSAALETLLSGTDVPILREGD